MRTNWIFIGGVLIPGLLAGAEPIPPHAGFLVPGIHAYADKVSVAAGEAIDFHVSSTEKYALSVVRLGTRIDDPSGDEVVMDFGKGAPATQKIHMGSYVHVEKGLPVGALDSLSLECWVRPWKLKGLQGIISQSDYPKACGVGLLLNENGAVTVYVGDGGRYRGEWLHSVEGRALEIRKWYHLVATWDGTSGTKAVWIDGKPAGSWKYASWDVAGGVAPLRLGAYGEGGVASHFLDGDLAMPAIYDRVLGEDEIAARFKDRGLSVPKAMACWLLDEERGEAVADAAGEREGRIINHATWMIGGPSFDAEAVPRYGEYDPGEDEDRGHGLRLASDDLYDCRWKATHSYEVPENVKPGIYVANFEFTKDAETLRYPVTFIVRKAQKAAKAPILIMCATNTWRAYSATPFAVNGPGAQFWPTKGLKNSPGDPPAYCFYRDHAAGQPTFQLGLRMPWPVAGPEVLYSPPEFGYSHLMRGERFTHAWLEESGYEYDVISNCDLDRDPGILEGYEVLIINGHDEYWSVPMYRGLESFLAKGGDAIVLSGNSMFWRVAFSDDQGVIECRKWQKDIGGRPQAGIGEIYHSYEGGRGSLMRNCGTEAWKLIGLDCIGWWGGRTEESFGIYKTEMPDHFLFHRPEEIGLAAGDTFGHAPEGRLPRVGGHEADVRVKTLLKMTKDVPEGAELPVEPEGILTLARIRKEEQRGIDYFTRWTPEHEGTVCELIYWERPEGGRVLNLGAIAGGWALSADPKLQGLMRNALSHFGVETGEPGR